MSRLAADHSDLGLGEHNVMLSATHTHCAPGGFSHYFLYNLAIPGFVEAVYDAIVEAIVEAIVKAARGAAPGRIRLAEVAVPPDVPLAFNRAIPAHNRNPEIAPRRWEEWHLAVDRRMRVLRFDTHDDRPLGALCFLPVHCNSVPSTNRLIHPDNKGEAARAFEAWADAAGHEAFVAAFPQGAAGDVSPNHRYVRRAGRRMGLSDDGFESAREHGRLQFEQALRAFEAAADAPPLGTTIRAAIRYADHASQAVPPALAGGVEGATTGPAVFGLALPEGTWDGPGPFLRLGFVRRAANAAAGGWRRLRGQPLHPQGNKFPFVVPGEGPAGRAFGLVRQDQVPLPGWIDAQMGIIRYHGRTGTLPPAPWIPHVLPVQVACLGSVALVAIPGEPTTVAGARLEADALAALASAGVDRAIVCGYANAYASYIATPEEYDRQDYEGASTLFGRWTLPAWRARLRHLAARLAAGSPPRPDDIGDPPPVISPDVLAPCRHEVDPSVVRRRARDARHA